MSNRGNAQLVAVSHDDRRNDGNAVSCFRKCQEIRGRSTLHCNFWLDLGKSTEGIERFADNKAGIQKQQWALRKGLDVDCRTKFHPERRMTSCQQLYRWHLMTLEGSVVCLNGMQQDAEMNFAALKHR